MNALIECRDLCHSYDDKQVLENLSFTVERGGIFGLLGKNGAGKSTTINILMGFLRPTSGTCRVLGEDSHHLSASVRQRIGLLHEGFVQYDFMSIEDLERYYAPFYPLWDRRLFYDLVDRLRVPYGRTLAKMSCGQRSQVVLGLIMAQQPELMILDDYSMGLDVGYRRLFIEFLRDYVTERGTTVLLTSHVVQEVDKIMDQMIVLREGQAAVSGVKDAFMARFASFRFKRTDASQALERDEVVSSVEHSASHTRLYGFLDELEVRAYLGERGVPCDDLEPLAMDFEDAFIGLTGKY